MALIDKEPIKKFIADGLNSCEFGHDAVKILAEIEFTPTVDTQEVVYCKDCRNKRAVFIGRIPVWRCPHRTHDVNLNGFCECGVKRDD